MAYDAEHFIATVTKPIDYRAITEPRERLVALSAFLRGLSPERFDMGYFSSVVGDPEGEYISATQIRTDCGTTACIAGWAVALFTVNERADGSGLAKNMLGLTDQQAGTLFYANSTAYDDDEEAVAYWDATPTQAANVIDNYLATGVIDWGKA